MENRTKREIIESFRERYHRGSRVVKGVLLEQVCALLDCHRKHAIRLLRRRSPGRKSAGAKRGPKSRYNDPAFIGALRLVWREMERRASKIIKADLPAWLPFIEKHHGCFEGSIRERLLAISAATIDRYLRGYKAQYSRRGGTRPGTVLRNEIPIGTNHWHVDRPGFVEADTVLHCGSTTEGEYVNSLDFLDIHSQWVVLRAVWGKGARGILDQIKDIESTLPFQLLGFDCDNGSEFLNQHLLRYFTAKKQKNNLFSFTRSREYMKNDNAHVEQKNWSTVRNYIGYERFDFPELVTPLNRLYKFLLCPYLNHFCATFKLDHKVLIKSRYRRIYDDPVTPYQRLMESPHVSTASKQRLKEEHDSLDPILLRRGIEQELRKILSLLKTLRTARATQRAA